LNKIQNFSAYLAVKRKYSNNKTQNRWFQQTSSDSSFFRYRDKHDDCTLLIRFIQNLCDVI